MEARRHAVGGVGVVSHAVLTTNECSIVNQPDRLAPLHDAPCR